MRPPAGGDARERGPCLHAPPPLRGRSPPQWRGAGVVLRFAGTGVHKPSPDPGLADGLGLTPVRSGRWGSLDARPRLEKILETAGPAGDLPVEEGGEEAPQQHLVLHPRAQVAVHQLATRDVDAGACGRHTQNRGPQPQAQGHGRPRGCCGRGGRPAGEAGSGAAPLQAWDPTLQAFPAALGPCHQEQAALVTRLKGLSPNCPPSLEGIAWSRPAFAFGKHSSCLSVLPEHGRTVGSDGSWNHGGRAAAPPCPALTSPGAGTEEPAQGGDGTGEPRSALHPAVWPGRAPARVQANEGQGGQEPRGGLCLPWTLPVERGASARVSRREEHGRLQGLIRAFVYDLTFYRARAESPHWKT